MRFDRQIAWRRSRVPLRARLSRRPPAPPKGRWSRETNPLGQDSTSSRPVMLACRNPPRSLLERSRFRPQPQPRRIAAAETGDDRRRHREVDDRRRLEMTGTAVDDQVEKVLVAHTNLLGIVERVRRAGGDKR